MPYFILAILQSSSIPIAIVNGCSLVGKRVCQLVADSYHNGALQAEMGKITLKCN